MTIGYRTNGETKNCRGCRYWSEMIAEVCAGVLRAYCLAPGRDSAGRGGYEARLFPGTFTCEAWASGHLGPVDEPGEDPLRYEMGEGQQL